MHEFNGRVAVITGAASGIGRALAQHAAELGMHLVISDIAAEPLADLADTLRQQTAVESFAGDIADVTTIQALADLALGRFGKVHLLFNNAGVSSGGFYWEHTAETWAWMVDVNLNAVFHGCRIFTPIMLQQGEPAHIVNTASMSGLTTTAGLAAYNVTKQGVVALSETMYHDLRLARAPIGVSVLCPGWVRTRIADGFHHGPPREANAPISSFAAKLGDAMRQLIADGLDPADVAATTFDAIESNRFYVLTHPSWKGSIYRRAKAILDEAPPVDPLADTTG